MNPKSKIKEMILTLKSWQFWKSILSGGITACVDLSLLFVFREKFTWSYWPAVNTAFAISILVNFSLQKFWTFSSQSLDVAHKQFVKFFIVAAGNMAMNSIIMFVLSVLLGFWYIGAQVLTIGALAIVNFILYRKFVFK